MSHYEHYKIYETIFKLLTRKSNSKFMYMNISKYFCRVTGMTNRVVRPIHLTCKQTVYTSKKFYKQTDSQSLQAKIKYKHNTFMYMKH